MKIVTSEHKLQTTAKKKEIAFKVDTLNPAIMIKIVSDMYPNPRRTLITEYVQNGVDSHRDAGCLERPLEVTLPTDLDPNYVVRDYGVGMTEQDIEETFRYVFRSTKNQNEDDLGGFGIGKLVFGAYSGLMYLDLYDGEGSVRNYLVRLKDGQAGCTEQYVQDTDGERGVKVTVPVFSKDIDYFEDLAVFQYGFMPTQPTIVGRPDFFDELNEWMKEDELLSMHDGRTKIYKTSVDYLPGFIGSHARRPQALIGGLPFNIDLDTLAQNVTNNKQSKLIRAFESRFFTLYFDSGEVDIVPSRDNLKYNTKTCRVLLQRLQDMEDELVRYVQEELKDHKVLNELYKAASGFKTLGYLTAAGWDDLEWNGTKNALSLVETTLGAFDGSNYYGGYKYYSGPPNDVSACYRYDEEMDDAYRMFKEDENEVLYKCEKYLYDSIDRLRRKRVQSYRYRTVADQIQLCTDRRSFMALFFKAFSDQSEDYLYAIVPGDVGRGDADKRLRYRFEDANYDEKDATTVAVYLKEGVTFDDFVAELESWQVGISTKSFVDVSDWDKPPATFVPKTGARKSANKGNTTFSDNTMFTFDKTGKSPSGSYNSSFWKPASADDLQDLDDDVDAQLVYVRVKAYKPDALDDDEIPKEEIMQRGWYDQMRTCSQTLKERLDNYESVLNRNGGNKRVVLIGVKPKVDMTEHPGVVPLWKGLHNDVFVPLFKTLPTKPSKTMNPENFVKLSHGMGMTKMLTALKKELDEHAPKGSKTAINKLFSYVNESFKQVDRGVKVNDKHMSKTLKAMEIYRTMGAGPDWYEDKYKTRLEDFAVLTESEYGIADSYTLESFGSFQDACRWGTAYSEDWGIYDSLVAHFADSVEYIDFGYTRSPQELAELYSGYFDDAVALDDDERMRELLVNVLSAIGGKFVEEFAAHGEDLGFFQLSQALGRNDGNILDPEEIVSFFVDKFENTSKIRVFPGHDPDSCTETEPASYRRACRFNICVQVLWTILFAEKTQGEGDFYHTSISEYCTFLRQWMVDDHLKTYTSAKTFTTLMCLMHKLRERQSALELKDVDNQTLSHFCELRG